MANPGDEAVARIGARPAPRIVAVDGGAGAGKTTYADQLAERLGAQVVHTDDLLDGWAGQFTFWDRLRSDVLVPFQQSRPGGYRRFDWYAGEFGDRVVVPPGSTLIVEGVSAIAACGSAASFRIFLDVPRSVREARWAARDGIDPQPEWTAWLDAEDAFFDAARPVADLVITDAEVAG